MDFRIGLGYDFHRLGPGRTLRLGGVEIPFHLGLVGHSDADCLVHAVMDALLGAAGEGDIGQLFPDTDPAYQDARSTTLLAAVMERLSKAGLEVVHVDSVIVAEKPSIAPHVPAMKRALCPLLGIAPDRLGIKAKTNEGFGAIGQSEAVACLATALVRKKYNSS